MTVLVVGTLVRDGVAEGTVVAVRVLVAGTVVAVLVAVDVLVAFGVKVG
jgi:uncharacterized membrane protein YczE